MEEEGAEGVGRWRAEVSTGEGGSAECDSGGEGESGGEEEGGQGPGHSGEGEWTDEDGEFRGGRARGAGGRAVRGGESSSGSSGSSGSDDSDDSDDSEGGAGTPGFVSSGEEEAEEEGEAEGGEAEGEGASGGRGKRGAGRPGSAARRAAAPFFSAPPRAFHHVRLSPFNFMWSLLSAWVTADTIAYVTEPAQACNTPKQPSAQRPLQRPSPAGAGAGRAGLECGVARGARASRPVRVRLHARVRGAWARVHTVHTLTYTRR